MHRSDRRVALITGCAGARGFGSAIARRLARDGIDLVLTDIQSEPTAPASSQQANPRPGGIASLAREVEALGVKAIAAAIDVASYASVKSVIEQAVATFGRVDILVNNAAAPPGKDRNPITEIPEEAWDLVMDVNLKGAFLCSKFVTPIMVRGGAGGRIVNVSSSCGKIGYANMGAYCASKFGLIGLTQAHAKEVARFGITVNAICPGVSDTDRTHYLGVDRDGRYSEDMRLQSLARRADEIPLGRVASVDDIAEAVAFLASERAAYVTGQSFNLSGGLIMH